MSDNKNLLTKEQIEAEGWSFTGRSVDSWFKKEGNWDMFTWTAYKAVLHYGFHDKKLTFYIDDFGTDHHVFQGLCENIETLRLIESLTLRKFKDDK